MMRQQERASADRFMRETLRLARLVLCGGIIGASSAGLLTRYETVGSDSVGAALGALVVIVIKLAHVL